ncbi:RHS repeat-associated core domain-containing protein [Pseudomonas viridiflava]|uniref:RHS repeat-associated core domain-containing protein n=1 Tax=Pseudomonas viridiflava TaxID=33069 RepID=UPI000F06254F|nr:RHS repeat-associated core domain-containing protein [Pseudomonas viridiflava]
MSRDALINYHYDAMDRLIGFDMPGTGNTNRLYSHGHVSSETQGDQTTVFLEHDDQTFGYCRRVGNSYSGTLFASNQQGTVLEAHTRKVPQPFGYTPYGHRSSNVGFDSLIGLNGEQPDPVTGCYLLGNGYRAYNPRLMRFQSPDNMSPFGAGGVNPYAYCVGDPINLSDPTGHFSFKSIFRIITAVAAIAVAVATLAIVPFSAPVAFAAITDIASNVLGIGSEVVKNLAPDSPTGDALDKFSLGFGAVSFVLGRGLLGKSKVLSPTKLVRRNISRIANTRIVKSASEVSEFYRSARKSLKAVSHLNDASDALSGLKYAKYAMSGLDVARDYVIPYLSPPNTGGSETWQPHMSGNADSYVSSGEHEGSIRALP